MARNDERTQRSRRPRAQTRSSGLSPGSELLSFQSIRSVSDDQDNSWTRFAAEVSPQDLYRE